MFEDSTFESTGRIHTRSRGWMIAALIVNGSILLALVLIPLIYPEALPRAAMRYLVEAPPPPPAAAPPVKRPEQRFHGAPVMNGVEISVPTQIPTHILIANAPEEAPPSSDFAGLGQAGGVPGGVGNVFRGGDDPPIVKQAPQGPAHVSSGVMAGQLIYKVTPLYPAIAVAARLEGTVVLQAVISKTGTIENLRVVSGPAMLRQAAIDAVKHWRYRPYALDAQAVEVETTVNVVFSMGR
ncbi:MAG: energy transducer TonB [Terracidiphilus sp.]